MKHIQPSNFSIEKQKHMEKQKKQQLKRRPVAGAEIEVLSGTTS